MKRRAVLASLSLIASALALQGCGFQLRGQSNFAFKTLHVAVAESSAFGQELKRTVAAGSDTRIVPTPQAAQAVMSVLTDAREKAVIGTTATGQVREFQLRVRLRFALRTPQGKELIPETELVVTRDVGFNESAALAKESEEALLYRAMQSDMVQQVMRRFAAVKSL